MNRPHVFSVQMPMIGHQTYGNLLRRSLADSTEITFEAKWTTDDVEFPFRIINRVLWQNFPNNGIVKRNLDLKRFRSCVGASLLANRLIDRALTRGPIDVLHFHTQNLALLSSKFNKKIPMVFTADATNKQIAREYPEWTHWTHEPAIAFEHAAVQKAKAVIAFSEWAANSFRDEYDVEAQRLYVVPVGIELDGFGRSARVRANTSPKRLLFVGNDFDRKGGRVLLDVFRHRLAEEDVELHIMTNDSSIDEAPGIFVHRGVTAFSSAWHDIYASADLFVLPTKREAFGIAYIEALAAGLPVIGSNVGAGPEIVSNDVGFVIDPENMTELTSRIKLLIHDDEMRRRFGVSASQRARLLYDAKKNGSALAQIFANAAS